MYSSNPGGAPISGASISGAPMPLGEPGFAPHELTRGIKGRIGSTALFYREASSTNDLALDLARQGVPHGAVIAADAQSAGRGRMGRRWLSPPSAGIQMSIILLNSELAHPSLLTTCAAIAAIRGIESATGLRCMIKWPNDIVVPRPGTSHTLPKLGGILAEAHGPFTILGIGLNVNLPQEALPRELAGLATSTLIETARPCPRTSIMRALAEALDPLINAGPEDVLAEARALSATLGRRVLATLGTRSITGLAAALDSHGRLVIETPGALTPISSGEVTHLRPAPCS